MNATINFQIGQSSSYIQILEGFCLTVESAGEADNQLMNAIRGDQENFWKTGAKIPEELIGRWWAVMKDGKLHITLFTHRQIIL